LTIEPDNKDWTWVLERPCAECGFDASAVAHETIAPLTRATAARWLLVLAEPTSLLRRRPEGRWSALEYACHVRDVFWLFDHRLLLMLNEDDPLFANWDQDRSAAADRYNEQDPSTVGQELVVTARSLAANFETVSGPMWRRRGRRTDGAAFTVASFGRYMIHDPLHHLSDVAEGFNRLSGRADTVG
jgi:hypothetical protein